MVLPAQESREVYVSITAPSRPFPSHCWMRAATHIRAMAGIDYFARMEAANACEKMAEAVATEMKAPQRVEPVKGFSWDSFKTITPIK